MVDVPDHLVLLVLEAASKPNGLQLQSWVLHGFLPGDLQQAQSLQETQHKPNRVFLLELTDDVCLERITLRATDPVSGVRFHPVTRPTPSCVVQSRLKTRPEDSTHTVTQALDQYRIHSAALQVNTRLES
ncbi:adenylate kinase 8-like [Betta splendens]|uniref:Adenylate kinase 8-like n=1 Tax=Betta splendens TaxID=158456 RepID=A0A9W2Y2E4_BETSP|nr:adenylate kinase 8-like [Betta splendens]